jgi:uncharacterized membrane protein YkvA (DUF1232 family)
MTNRFFRLATQKALRLAGKPAQLLVLAIQAGKWMSSGQALRQLKEVRTEASAMTRMVSAYSKGVYRLIPKKSLLGVAAALIYFINPFDLIPDALVGLGLTDDAAVLTWVYHRVRADVQAFVFWEQSRVTADYSGHPTSSS